MKKILITLAILAAGVFGLHSCICHTGDDAKTKESEGSQEVQMATTPNGAQPLNITVLLDLSDRIIKAGSQPERDVAIVNYLFQKIIDQGKFTRREDAFRVLFYPTSDNHMIDSLSGALAIDLSESKPLERKGKIVDFKNSLEGNFAKLYSHSMEKQQWIGCDIWGLFHQEDAEVLCVRPGYRNVLVILTDGYLFHADNKLKEGNNYSYILDQTLAIPDARLIKCPQVSDLEVLILECNPTAAAKYTQMKTVLSDWLTDMEISHFGVHKTDSPANSRVFIDKFLD